MRYLIVLLASLALVLAACQGEEEDPFAEGSPDATLDLFGSPSPTVDASPDASPIGSPDTETSPGASPTATVDASPTGSPGMSPGETDDADATPTGSPTLGIGGDECEDAFADVPDFTRLTSLSAFNEAIEALDETIRSCDSVDDWTEQAEQQLNVTGMDLDAEEFLQARCDDSDALSDTQLCEEV